MSTYFIKLHNIYHLLAILKLLLSEFSALTKIWAANFVYSFFLKCYKYMTTLIYFDFISEHIIVSI